MKPLARVLKGNYTISAYAAPVPGETDMADNTFVDGWILITIPGDVSGDSNVNFSDAILLGAVCSSQPSDSNWNADADINSDSIVNFLDAIIR